MSFLLVTALIICQIPNHDERISATFTPKKLYGDGTVILQDAQRSTACGPISCYVAMRMSGVDISYDSVSKDLNWVPNKPINLKDIVIYLKNQKQIDVELLLSSIDELRTIISNDSAQIIISIDPNTASHENDGVKHAVTIVGYSQNKFTIFDYPAMFTEISDQDLSRLWDRKAIVVKSKYNYFIVYISVFIAFSNFYLGFLYIKFR